MTALLNPDDFDVKIGGDPEFFIFNTRTKRYVSAHDRVPGTKQNPFMLDSTHHPAETVQADGTAVEINIQPGESSIQIITSVSRILEQVSKRFLSKSEKLVASPCVTYSEKDWARIPEKSLELGCDPDYNAYSMERNPTPDPTKFLPRSRTGAGHISLSWRPQHNLANPFDPDHFAACAAVVRRLDLLYFTYIYPYIEGPDTPYGALSSYRHQLYGARGAFRPKPWGVEYRSPSNIWLLRQNSITAMVQLAKASLVSVLLDVPDRSITTHAERMVRNRWRYVSALPAISTSKILQTFSKTPRYMPVDFMWPLSTKSRNDVIKNELIAPLITKPGEHQYVRS